MIRQIAFAAAVSVLLMQSTAFADELACDAARYAAAAGFSKCEAKAMAKQDEAKFAKCRARYAAVWPKLQLKHPDTTCALDRFVDNGTTITDNLTLLVWEKKDSSDGMSNMSNRHDADNLYTWSASSTNADGTVFTDFLNQLNSSCFAGQCDWRLPSIFELHTILEPGCPADPCVDPLFVPARSGIFAHWTSTTNPINPSLAWASTMLGGLSGSVGKLGSDAARAVRGGQ